MRPIQKILRFLGSNYSYDPAGSLCDALATAVMVAGNEGATWFSRPGLADYQLFVIERDENNAWSI